MKNKTLIACLLAIAALCLAPGARGQDVAVKTNLVYDAVLSPSLGLEIALAPRWTLDLSGSLNVWHAWDDQQWKHWMVQPEVRYWFCDRFSGHFIALHAHGGQYNIGNLNRGIDFLGTDFNTLKDYRAQGWFVGGGVAYGYVWILSRHWNLEGEVGLGYAYSIYDRFECADCGQKVEEDKEHHYFGPTKLAINIVYVF